MSFDIVDTRLFFVRTAREFEQSAVYVIHEFMRIENLVHNL